MFNVYVDDEVVGKLLESTGATEDFEKQDMLIELIDSAPLSAEVSYEGDDAEITIYVRDEMHTNYQVAHHGKVHDGQVEIDEGDEETISIIVGIAEAINKYIYENDMVSRCSALDEDAEGVLFELNDEGDITAEVVEGKERPLLLCASIMGGVSMMRPYMNEILYMSGMEMMSVEDLEEMAEDGNVDAMERLAELYFEGDDDIDPDPEKSYYWLIKCADAGNATAMYNVGLRKAKGYGTDRNLMEAAEWMQKAAEAGDEDGAEIAEKYKEMADAEKKAKAGDAKSQAIYATGLMGLAGSLYQAGEGSDYEECLMWAQKSVDQGCADGYWPLALAYHHGRGVEENIEKAIEYYKKGADGGNAKCQHNLGCEYMTGEFLEKDTHKAFDLIKASAEQGYGLAMADLGRCYQFAFGTTGNMKKAVEWYEKSLEVNYDPELKRKTQVFKSILEELPEEGEDYPEFEGDFDFSDPMAGVDLSGLFSEDEQTLEDFCNGIEVGGGKKKKSASKEKKKTSEEKAALNEKSDLDEGILCGLKCDAESIYSSLTLIAKGLKGQKFENPSQDDEADDDSSSDNEYDEEEYEEDNPIDDFTDYLYGIDGVDSSGLSYRYNGFRNSFELSIWTKYVRPVDLTLWIFPLDYYLEVKLLEADGTFNPNSLAKNLINKINELDKDKIFEQLKGDVKKAIDEGKEVESIVSYDYIQKQLNEEGNVFEVQGTQYEGRNDRIEKVKKGDKLSLQRESDNEHDKNAIDIRNKSGSLGHLPWYAANLLSPAIDAGLIEAEAEVVEVTPLSQRSKRAKKALLNVKINISKAGSKKTKTPKSSSTSKSKNIGGDINNTEEKKKTDKKKAEEKKNIEEQKKIEERKKEKQKKKYEKIKYEKLLDEVENKNALTGLLFALTGDCHTRDLESFIIALGGEVKNYVTKKTNYVISDDNPEWETTKIKTAKERGIEIINEGQFLELLNRPTNNDCESPDSKVIDKVVSEGKQIRKKAKSYPQIDLDFVSVLKEKYAVNEIPTTIKEFEEQNIEYSEQIKELKRAVSRSGMTFGNYLKYNGLIQRQSDKYDPTKFIETLKSKYANSSDKPITLKQLMLDNPEYAEDFNRLKAVSSRLYGKTIGDYLKSLGLINTNEKESVLKQKKKEERAAAREIERNKVVNKIEIEDEILSIKVDRMFEKLEALYPEHKVFALDSIDSTLRENLTNYSKQIGYMSADDMLKAYGYEKISKDETKKIRPSVIYTPGNEPEIIKSKVENVLRRLEEYYPSRKIERGIEKDHKKLSKSISGVYQWLGYESIDDFLKAYGYDYSLVDAKAGRPSTTNVDEVIAELKRRSNGKPYHDWKELQELNPDLSGKLKTIANKSKALFGMPLGAYLKQEGILA